MLPALQASFGFSSFRPGQSEAVASLLAGRDTLVVMPTGAGKSLIYQFAALQRPGLALVISPLIALMKDQVDGLARLGIPATFINSALSAADQAGRLRQLAQGKYRLVYVAPERLRNLAFLQALRAQTLSLLAVDEAHCVSEWGHDFRPDYLHIARFRAALGHPLTAALTATATPKVQDDVIRLLGMDAAACRIVTGFNRPNLSLNVLYTHGLPAKLRALREHIAVAVLADSLEKAAQKDRHLLDQAIVVASDAEKGGTWAGAVEALKAKWVPVFVLHHPAMPEGNRLLLQKGALKFPYPFPRDPLPLKDWLDGQAAPGQPEPFQSRLF